MTSKLRTEGDKYLAMTYPQDIKVTSEGKTTIWLPVGDVQAIRGDAAIRLHQSLSFVDQMDKKIYIARVIGLAVERQRVLVQIYSQRS